MRRDFIPEAKNGAHAGKGRVGRAHAEGCQAAKTGSEHGRLSHLFGEVVDLDRLSCLGSSGGLRFSNGRHRDGRVRGPGEHALVEDDGASHDVVAHVQVVVVLGARH